jgi:acetylornithine deacetylase
MPGTPRDPFKVTLENDKLYGLGSNDAGGCLQDSITYVHPS